MKKITYPFLYLVCTSLVTPHSYASFSLSRDVIRPAGKVVGGAVKPVQQGLDAVARPLAKGIQGTGDGVAKVGHEVLKDVGDLAENTVGETSKALGKTIKYVEENPIEAAIMIAAVAYGGYLVYSGDYAFVITIGEKSIVVAEGGAAKAIGASAAAAAGGSAGTNAERNRREAVRSDRSAAKPPQQVTGEKKSDVPLWRGSQVPERSPTDGQKMEYLFKIKDYIDRNPITDYSRAGLPKDLTPQERKLTEGLLMLGTLQPTEADKIAADGKGNNEDHARSIGEKAAEVIVEGAKGVSKGARVGVEILTTHTPTADGTLAGEGARTSMKTYLDQKLNEYWKQRNSQYQPIDRKEIQEAIEGADGPRLLPAK